jgi:hypothetical protein
METSGKAVINPASSGFLPASHDAKTITNAAMPAFNAVKIMIVSLL